jgi:hypothetical protein
VENHGGLTEIPTNVEPIMKDWKKVLLEQIWSWLKHKDKDEWLNDMRGNLSLVATVIATLTFQMALSPPGGVRPAKDDGNSNADVLACTLPSNVLKVCPGEAILAVIFSDDYKVFLRWNTICFLTSLSVLLLLVSGISLNHRFPTWLLSIGMCLTLTSLVITYITAVQMVTPDPLWGPAKDYQKRYTSAWIGLMSLVAFLHTLRLIIWVFYIRKSKQLATISPNIARENIQPA